MVKDDNTTLLIVGGIAVLGLGGLFLFKDQILGAIQGAGQTIPEIPDSIPEVPDDPPIQQPVKPSGTPVAFLQGINYYAERIAEEIDKNDVKEVGVTTKLNIKANVILHHKSDLEKILEANNMQLGAGATSLSEKGLRIFATILLKTCQRMRIRLKPEAQTRFTLQAAGKYKILSKMAFTLS